MNGLGLQLAAMYKSRFSRVHFFQAISVYSAIAGGLTTVAGFVFTVVLAVAH